MIFQVLSFLMEVVVTLVGGACLMRAYMRRHGLGLANPLGRLVTALSDWIVLPLQRVLPPARRWDGASLLGAWLLKLLQYGALTLLAGGVGWAVLPLVALLGVGRLAVSVATAMLIVAAVFSWTQNHTPMADVFERLSAPLLTPVRRLLPSVGGVDLSPLVVIVLLQVAGIVLASLQQALYGAGLSLAAGA